MKDSDSSGNYFEIECQCGVIDDTPQPSRSLKEFHEAELSNHERMEIIKIACLSLQAHRTVYSDPKNRSNLEKAIFEIYDLYAQGRKADTRD